MSSALFELRVQLEQNQAYNLDKNVVFSVFFTANTIPVPVRIWSKLIANCQACDFCDKIVMGSSMEVDVVPRCLKITEKVSFYNIVKVINFVIFWITKACRQDKNRWKMPKC